MNRLVQFIKNIYVLIIFIVLEIVAINYYVDNSVYAKAKVLIMSNKLTGRVHGGTSGMFSYFGLRSENDVLIERISHLNNELYNQRALTTKLLQSSISLDSLEGEPGLYLFTAATIINNTINHQENYLTIDKGSRDGVDRNMALITPDGCIVGYVLESSANYSIAISLLNSNFRTGGKIKDKEFFGSVWWDGSSHTHVTLSEVPKYAEIMVGDTIVTGYSSIFPPDIIIGTVESYELTPSTYYDVNVKLATRFATLNHVLIANYADAQERELLESSYLESKK